MNKEINLKHIDVLDGIRAIAVLIIVWFHFWEQSWIMPIGFGINLDWLPRTGYVMVDMLLLISGFCLFLPHARHMVLGEKLQSIRDFYFKRLVRILPSYLFCILIVLFVFDLPTNAYKSTGAMLKDIITHLSFTHTFFVDTYTATQLNGVLWTLAIEMQFYFIFPLVAFLFRKKPLICYGVMTLISLIYNWYVFNYPPKLPEFMAINQLPTFMCVYANGMMAALVLSHMGANRLRQKYEGMFFTALTVFCLFVYWLLMQDLCQSPLKRSWMLFYRYPLSLLFGIFIISAALSASFLRALLSNRLMRFISAISFNLYIWHQFLAVKLKELRIPPWSGDLPPNQTGDKVWMWQYFILIWVVGVAAAVLVSFFIEMPAAAWLTKKWNNYKAGREKISAPGQDV